MGVEQLAFRAAAVQPRPEHEKPAKSKKPIAVIRATKPATAAISNLASAAVLASSLIRSECPAAKAAAFTDVLGIQLD